MGKRVVQSVLSIVSLHLSIFPIYSLYLVFFRHFSTFKTQICIRIVTFITPHFNSYTLLIFSISPFISSLTHSGTTILMPSPRTKIHPKSRLDKNNQKKDCFFNRFCLSYYMKATNWQRFSHTAQIRS